MSLTLDSSTVYARRYDITRNGVDYFIDLDLRALWRPLDVGSYRVTVQGQQQPIAQGPWAGALGGSEVATFFTALLDAGLGGNHALTVNGSTDFATEHAVTYNAGDVTEASYLIRLDIQKNRRAVLDASGQLIDGGAWAVDAMTGAPVAAFFEDLIYAATGVAPV